MENFTADLFNQLATYYNDLLVLLPKAVLAIFVFTVLFFVANRSRSFVNDRLNKRMDDPLLAKFLARMVKIGITVVAVLFVLKIVGLSDIAAGIITGASVSAIVVGFAFRDIGENLLSGIMLAFDRPFRIGDSVELVGKAGKVVALNLKNTQIKTPDGKDIFIPNASVIKNAVVNHTIDGFTRNEFIIRLDYGSDVGGAIAIIQNQLATVPGILQKDKLPSVQIGDLAVSTLNLTVQYWLNTFDLSVSGAKVKTEAINKILKALDNAGYYLPGDIVELKNYNNLPLVSGENQKMA